MLSRRSACSRPNRRTEQALSLTRAVRNCSGEAITLNNIGSIHSALGDKASALELYAQALPLQRAVGNRSGEAITLFNIASIHDSAGRTEEAITLLEHVVEIDEATQSPKLELHQREFVRVRVKLNERLVARKPKPLTTPPRLRWLLLAFLLAFFAALVWFIFLK